MMNRSLQRSAVVLIAATTLVALVGGCATNENGELETFAWDLLRSALAAFLL